MISEVSITYSDSLATLLCFKYFKELSNSSMETIAQQTTEDRRFLVALVGRLDREVAPEQPFLSSFEGRLFAFPSFH